MKKILYLAVIALIFNQVILAQSTAIRFANSEMKRSPEAWQLDHGKRLYFENAHGVGTLAIL